MIKRLFAAKHELKSMKACRAFDQPVSFRNVSHPVKAFYA
jgi:hypothetical protein